MNRALRTFMLGWEFPPYISGGLGTACYGLTKAMDRLGMQVVFALPMAEPMRFGGGAGGRQKAACEHPYPFRTVEFRTIASALRPYVPAGQFAGSRQGGKGPGAAHAGSRRSAHISSAHYGSDLFAAVEQYAQKAVEIARHESFDILHAHDWMTFPAAMAVAGASGAPLVVQVHSTEFDRSGEHVNQQVYDIERAGMHAADKVITVSHYTRNIILHRYGVPGEKVEVVYNGVEYDQPAAFPVETLPVKTDKIVLFLGRITMQKGPEYFLRAASRVLEKMDNVKFIMAGSGDLLYQSVEMAAELGIGHKVLFTRFLRGTDVDKAYQMADLYVMPSVSEPFGIAPLEALRHNVPVLISKQSGISEILHSALKVDFWDIDQMADKIIAVLQRPPLHQALRDNGASETSKFRWEDSAARIYDIYETTFNAAQAAVSGR